jgi:hypothetical protein
MLKLVKYIAVIIGGGLVLLCALFVYMLLGAIGLVWTPYTCLTDVLEQAAIAQGRYFEVSETSCSGLGKGPADISVFASRTKRDRGTLIFKYERMHDGSRDAEPVITSTDDRTIRISVKHVATIICRSGQWENQTIEYDIARIVVEAYDGPPECKGN